MRGTHRAALAVGSGVSAAAAFPPLGWSLLLVPAVAGMTLAVRGVHGRKAVGTGFLFGCGFMGALLPWLQVIGVDAWIGLTVLQAAFYGVLGWGLARTGTLPVWPAWAACWWVLAELVRSVVPWGGFPWGRLAFATVETPLAPAMALVGTSGTTFLVALVGNLLAWLLLWALGRRRRAGAALAAVAGVVLTLAAPSALADLGATSQPGGDRTVRVAAVQGDVPGEGMAAFAERRAVLENHVAATHELAQAVEAGGVERPDFVLWPENSTDIDPFTDPSVHSDIQGAVDAVGTPVLVGAMVAGPGPRDVRNEGIVWSPGTGPGQRYAKTHPVPFGEYIPHRAQLARLFERLDQIPRDMVPGTEPGVLTLAGTTIGDLICFEVAYDGLVRDVVAGGAELLVVQTNNATYMGTGQVEQQFAIARLRAIESDRYVVVVATNGVSGLIAPDGSVIERAPVRERAVLQADLPVRTTMTPALRWGRGLELGLALAALVALAAAVVLDRRAAAARRGAVPDAPEPTPVGSER